MENILANTFTEFTERNLSGRSVELYASNGRIRSDDNVRRKRARRDANNVDGDIRSGSGERLRLGVQMGVVVIDFLTDIYLRRQCRSHK